MKYICLCSTPSYIFVQLCCTAAPRHQIIVISVLFSEHVRNLWKHSLRNACNHSSELSAHTGTSIFSASEVCLGRRVRLIWSTFQMLLIWSRHLLLCWSLSYSTTEKSNVIWDKGSLPFCCDMKK